MKHKVKHVHFVEMADRREARSRGPKGDATGRIGETRRCASAGGAI